MHIIASLTEALDKPCFLICKNRTSAEKIFPGGKGINVSIVLNNLGLKNTALGFEAGFTGKEYVIDAYCGIGTISLFLARHAKHVYGVEIIEEAIADAKKNAALNGFDNTTFYVGKAEEVLPEKYETEGIYADVIVVDPPRKGLNADTIEALDRMDPRRIVYVSCDPATLARDVALLKERGYTLKNAIAADLFPRCAHVETVVLLSREKVDDYIRISVHTKDLKASQEQ